MPGYLPRAFRLSPIGESASGVLEPLCGKLSIGGERNASPTYQDWLCGAWMALSWTPSSWGRLLTRSGQWTLRLDEECLELVVGGVTERVPLTSAQQISVRPGLLWADISLRPGQSQPVSLDGLPNRFAADLQRKINGRITRRAKQDRFRTAYGQLRPWTKAAAAVVFEAREKRRWITFEQQEAVGKKRPQIGPSPSELKNLLQDPDIRAGMTLEAVQECENGLGAWDAWHERTPAQIWDSFNEEHVRKELIACGELFDRVENMPLSEEQARAVLCFDNRVLVVASAGSGKTSTMVAKAAYAIHRGFVEPDRIVMLAFNKQAAIELKERAARSFERAGMEPMPVQASTFHALGLSIIGKATGEKPDIPDWAIDTVAGFRKLAELIDQLKDRSLAFRTQWDLFRFVFSRDLPAFGAPDRADTWDDQGNGRLRTARGELVRSQEEIMIANWLFLNGVDYRYEERYKFNTADEDHRQYKPDFFYPSIELYHEHFALNAQGQAPAHFEGYLDGVVWKRQLHQEKGTALFETTSHGIRNGADFKRMENELVARGLTLDPNPDRPIPPGGEKPMDPAELIGLMRTFISHAKSNCLAMSALYQRLEAMPENAFKYRHRMFLNIVGPALEAWDAALRAEGGIDFEDMLNQAAEHLEAGRYEAPYDLVLADEFQDASRARARLCRALVQKPNRFLFAVGDDWQSINRFAGADVSVMTGFRNYFGPGQALKLEQTFRCPQALCDVSSQFIAKNPAQIKKRVHSSKPASGPVLQALQVDSKDKLIDAVEQFLVRLAQQVQDGTVAPGKNGKVSVYILGRYNADRQYLPTKRSGFDRFIDVSFITIHRSKGSEADYVILPEMLSVLRGRSFPNTRADDPVLALAMPEGDNFPLGEERRLFYVALTRARRSVAMFTTSGQCSSFLQELEEDGAVAITGIDGKVVQEENCPACKQGVMVLRSGPYGEFRSCSNFPACSFKPKKRGTASFIFGDQNRKKVFSPPAAPMRPIPPARTSLPPKKSAPSSITPSREKARLTLSSIFNSIDGVMSDITTNIDRARAFQEATSELKGNIHAERSIIEAAFNLAKNDIDLEERFKNPRFRETYEELMSHLKTDDKPMSITNPAPTFVRTRRPPGFE